MEKSYLKPSESILRLLHKPELYFAPKVLTNPDWFYIKSFSDLTFTKIGIHAYYVLKYKRPTKFDIYTIKKISKTEKLFYNSGICNGYYYCKFVIRDCDTFMFDTNVALGTAFIRGNSIAEFQTFINNKKPQLQK